MQFAEVTLAGTERRAPFAAMQTAAPQIYNCLVSLVPALPRYHNEAVIVARLKNTFTRRDGKHCYFKIPRIPMLTATLLTKPSIHNHNC